MPGGSATR